MSDKFLDDRYYDDTPLYREIDDFVQMLVTGKLLRFDLAQTTARFPMVAGAGLLEKSELFSPEQDGTFKKEPQIMYAFYRHFRSVFNYALEANTQSIINFSYQVGDHFQTTSRHGVSSLVSALTKFLLSNEKAGSNVNMTIYALSLQLKDGPHKFFTFFNNYFDVFLLSNESFDSVWEVCRHFALQLGAPKGMDFRWTALSQFIPAWVDHHKTHLTAIRAIAETNQSDPALKYLYLQLLHKVWSENALSTEEFFEWLDNDSKKEQALALLMNINIEEGAFRQKILDKIAGLTLTEDQKLERLLVYIKLLERSPEDSHEFQRQLLDKIKGHFQDPELTDLSTSIGILGNSQNEPEARYAIIEEILNDENLKPEYLANTNKFFISNKDISRFFRFLKAATLKTGSASIVEKAMNNATYFYREDKPVNFEYQSILLCTDSEGICRLLGLELLLKDFDLNKTASLRYDITQLDALEQYKLVLSILNQFRPANHTIPITLKLLDSKSEIVKELIACKLEELISSYMYEVIEHVDNCVPPTNPQKADLLTRLNKVWNDLSDMLDKKRSIKEFDPHLSKTSEMRMYMRASVNATRQITKKVKKEHRGILSMITHTQVARGGGTVLPDGTVSPMMQGSVSFTIPRTIFITPERNDYELQKLLSSNWDQDFKQWEQIILSSGII